MLQLRGLDLYSGKIIGVTRRAALFLALVSGMALATTASAQDSTCPDGAPRYFGECPNASVPNSSQDPAASALSALDRVTADEWMNFDRTIVLRVLREAPLSSLQDAARYDARAQLVLGMAYGLGAGGLPESPIRYGQYVQMAASQGDPLGQAIYAALMLDGEEELRIRPDDEFAMQLIRDSAARGNAMGQTFLGTILYEGRPGVQVNREEGIRLLRAAARQGQRQAQAFLSETGVSW